MQSGGLIGVSLEVQVTSGGKVVAADRRSGRSSTTELTPAQMGEIERLYSAAASARYPQNSSACSDCFVYELTLTSGDRSRTVRLDDTSFPGTGAEPLIAYLIRLRESALGAP
jgi:hypothetical protein